MTVEQRVDKLEMAVDKLRGTSKDRWDKASAVAAILLPLALAFLAHQFASTMKTAEINLEARRSADQNALAQAAQDQQRAIARSNTRVSQADILSHFIDALTGTDRAKQRVAIHAVLIALPEDGPSLVQDLTAPFADEQTKQVAKTALTARIDDLVAGLFDTSPATRQNAYSQLTSSAWRANPDVLGPLLNMARSRRDNENGLYNTVVTLKDLSRAVTNPRKAEINALCSEITSGRPRIAQQCANLQKWIDTRR
jgi:hypothetical protein